MVALENLHVINKLKKRKNYIISGFSWFLNNFPTFIVRLKLSLSPKIVIILLKNSNNQRESGFFFPFISCS
jgi:hypothetical protein